MSMRKAASCGQPRCSARVPRGARISRAFVATAMCWTSLERLGSLSRACAQLILLDVDSVGSAAPVAATKSAGSDGYLRRVFHRRSRPCSSIRSMRRRSPARRSSTQRRDRAALVTRDKFRFFGVRKGEPIDPQASASSGQSHLRPPTSTKRCRSRRGERRWCASWCSSMPWNWALSSALLAGCVTTT